MPRRKAIKPEGEPSIAEQARFRECLVDQQLDTLGNNQADYKENLETNLKLTGQMLEVLKLQKEILDRDETSTPQQLLELQKELEELKTLNESLLMQNPDQQPAQQEELLYKIINPDTVPEYQTLLQWKQTADAQREFQNTYRNLIEQRKQCSNSAWKDVICPFLESDLCFKLPKNVTHEQIMNALYLRLLAGIAGQQDCRVEETCPYFLGNHWEKTLDLLGKLLQKERQPQPEKLEKVKQLKVMLPEMKQKLREQLPQMKSLLKDIENLSNEVFAEYDKGNLCNPQQIEQIRETMRLYDQQYQQYNELTTPIKKQYRELVDYFLDEYTYDERQEMGETDQAVLQTILNQKEQQEQKQLNSLDQFEQKTKGGLSQILCKGRMVVQNRAK